MVENNLNLFIRFYHPKTWNPILILIELPPPIVHIDRYHIQKLVQNIWCWSYPPRKPWDDVFHRIHLFNSYPRILCLKRIHTVREDSIINSKPYLSEISLINNSPILGLSPWTLLFIPPMNHRLIGIELRVLYTIGSKYHLSPEYTLNQSRSVKNMCGTLFIILFFQKKHNFQVQQSYLFYPLFQNITKW